MNGVSVCSGVGLLDLGLKLLLGDRLRVVRYVEREAHAAATLVKRMGKGWLDTAPIWDDLFTFRGDVIRRGVGRVDLVYGGIPCQPHSAAGQRRGAADERDLWPETARLLREVHAGGFFLENVPLIARYYWDRIRPELRDMGYETEEGLFSAAEVGLSHRRERFFALAVSGRQHEHLQQSLRWLSEHQGSSDGVALTNGSGRGSSVGELREGQPDLVGSSVGDAEGERQATTGSGAQPKLSRLADSGSIMVDTDENGRDQGTHGLRSRRDADIPASPTYPSDTEGWARVLAEMPALEPALCKLADGSAPWLAESRHQLRGLGNAVVPLTAAKALATLGGRMR